MRYNIYVQHALLHFTCSTDKHRLSQAPNIICFIAFGGHFQEAPVHWLFPHDRVLRQEPGLLTITFLQLGQLCGELTSLLPGLRQVLPPAGLGTQKSTQDTGDGSTAPQHTALNPCHRNSSLVMRRWLVKL